MKRREFIKTSVAASVLGSVGAAAFRAAAASPAKANREYYELRHYRLKEGASRALLDGYLAKALIPALNRLGINPVGVFTQQERTGTKAATEVRDEADVVVLIPHSAIDSVAATAGKLETDAQYQKDGVEFLQATRTNPAYERIDSSLMAAFTGMPKLEQPAYSRENKPRMFEIRTYESHNEVKAAKKVEMFNSGEIELMRELGMGPIFYGQALIGRDLPHLTYMLSAENSEAHKKHWEAFGKHPVWNKLKSDPQFADTVSHITNRFLVPTAYSQI